MAITERDRRDVIESLVFVILSTSLLDLGPNHKPRLSFTRTRGVVRMSSVVYDLLRESDLDAAIAIERAGESIRHRDHRGGT